MDASVLDLDLPKTVERICERIKESVAGMRKRGAVVAISGGIDSSVCATLSARALGRENVVFLILPERDSSSRSGRLGHMLADHLNVERIVCDIAPTLDAIGCYRWRDDAIRAVFPEYGEGWKNKIVIAGGLERGINFHKLVVEDPSGNRQEKRLGPKEYLQIVAAQNFKQRIRKTLEYFHADRLNYLVIGTPNRLEYDQGFFVKNGDGSADMKPIAHLYKTQVYALARHLGLPAEVVSVRPTTDTFSLEQGQDEFYFALPYEKMDLALWAKNHGRPAAELAAALGISEHQAELVYRDIDAKRRTTRYLHARPELVEPVEEIAK
ncbi:MAG TPA: NAD(+) synthase [Polyangiaceae bacterium]|nr:NAD(+) synthase [Polyangiaceae bacterium]